MQQAFKATVGFDLGNAALRQALDNGDQVCQYEKHRIELVNMADSIEGKARLKVLSEEREALRRQLSGIVDPAHDSRYRRRYFITIALILGLAGLSFAHLALAPFGLGLYIWPYAAGLALVCAALTDMFLEKCGSVRVVKFLTAGAFVSSIAGLLILAFIRGDILLLYLKNALAVANDTGLTNVMDVGDAVQFYQAAARKLQWFFGLLAASLELATGMAVWEARKLSGSSENAVAAAKLRLAAIDETLPTLARQIVYLENEPRIFEAEFKREFQRGLLGVVERAGVTRQSPLLLVFLIGLVLGSIARGQTTVVTALDYSQSDAVAMRNGSTPHHDNIEGAAKIIAELPAGAKFSVIGITAESFARPLILLSGQIPADPGSLSFIDRVTIARNRYAADLRKTGSLAKPDAAVTDVLGSLMLASDIFRQSRASQRILVIFSDMRQSARPLNIETPKLVPVAPAMRTTESAHLLADLKGVEVYIYGVHAAGKDVAYWQSLSDYWHTYFAKSGASVRAFSMLRDLPDFTATNRN